MGINFHFTQYSWLDLNTVILTYLRICEDYDDFSNNDRKPTFVSLFLHNPLD